MEPAVKAQSVFLFTKPSAGKAFGYIHDRWGADGTFHYTGDGQVWDQSPDEGGNRALLKAASLGRTVRVFRSEGVHTTYVGVFTLADPPYFRADAPDRKERMRSVLVFRLVPQGEVKGDLLEPPPAGLSGPQEIPLEAASIEAYVVSRPDEPAVAVRHEAELVKTYAAWAAGQGHVLVRHRIPLPGGVALYTDVYDATAMDLIEAKASAARPYVRIGLGQLLDYSRFITYRRRALLLPNPPADDLVALLHAHGVDMIWRKPGGFGRADAPD